MNAEHYNDVLELTKALYDFVPRHNGNPTAEECKEHSKRIDTLAEILVAYLGGCDTSMLVSKIAEEYKKCVSPDDDDCELKLYYYNEIEEY